MVVRNLLLQTLSDVFNQNGYTEIGVEQASCPLSSQAKHTTTRDQGNRNFIGETARARLKAEREWCGAIAALEQLLLQEIDLSEADKAQCPGLVLSGPAPVFNNPTLLSCFQTGIFTPDAFKSLALTPFQLPAAQAEQYEESACPSTEFPLVPADPLATEQFCLVFTSSFGLVIMLGEDATDTPAFQFSFDPEVIHQAWATLRSRLWLTSADHLKRLDTLIEQFAPPTPDYRIVMQFSRQLLKHLPDIPAWDSERLQAGEARCIKTVSPREQNSNAEKPVQSVDQTHQRQQANPNSPTLDYQHMQLMEPHASHTPEVELLQALTHEIRTPLTTIRTLTRLLLKKRHDLTADVIRRLEVIDQECSEQINRMELIFRAAELETTPIRQEQVQLTRISLEQVFQQSIPCWKKQAQRRNVTLDVVLPKKLPTVVSNPAMLDQVLTGLMESFTRSLPSGGQIRVQVTMAGHQIKLQLRSQSPSPTEQSPFSANLTQSPVKTIGQLLMFQPETGCLSLNLDVTKNLFHALGGKLIVRQRHQQGNVLTIFLPLDSPQSEGDWKSVKDER